MKKQFVEGSEIDATGAIRAPRFKLKIVGRRLLRFEHDHDALGNEPSVQPLRTYRPVGRLSNLSECHDPGDIVHSRLVLIFGDDRIVLAGDIGENLKLIDDALSWPAP